MTTSIAQNQEAKNLAVVVLIFNQLFAETENTVLISGADEPFYQASTKDNKAKIHSRADYLSSALHEMAHWIIAGDKRRQLDDFGYWYESEGRTLDQQSQFEKVEVKPQAIEWLLSLACNQPFNFSADNLSQELEASVQFKQAVYQQAKDYLENGLPQRAEDLFKELKHSFIKSDVMSNTDWKLELKKESVSFSASELEFKNV